MQYVPNTIYLAPYTLYREPCNAFRSLMKLVVTIDVEEDGLFSGRYDSHDIPANNVSGLGILDPIFRDLGIRPTLLVSYQVACHQLHHELLMQLSEKWEGEIGAHLHTWNTPPFEPSPYAKPVPSELMPRKLLTAKLENLFEAINRMGVDPVSFRMGRFNLGPKMLSILEETRIQVDSSIAPMRRYYGGPAHLSAKTDPYFPNSKNPLSPGKSKILEVPITILPLRPRLGSFLEHISEIFIIPHSWISWFARDLASIPAQPMLTGLGRLKAAVRLHRIRGGNVVTTFFHSSELMPGGCPQHPTEVHVERFLRKLRRFLSWLRSEMNVESLTMSQIRTIYHQPSPSFGKLTDESS